jgi:hypothetical protein
MIEVVDLAAAAAQTWEERWLAFVIVLAASLISACIVVATYALGLRLLAVAGRVPVVEPAAFTGAITIIPEEVLKQRRKQAKKAKKRSPLTKTQRKWARFGAYVCFALSGMAVLFGIYLIVPALHS